MRELTDEQVEKAREAWCKALDMPYTAFDIPLAHKCFNGIAPFLQLPWSEPTEDEIQSAAQEFFGRSHLCDVLVSLDVCKQFVRRRNAALLPNPVDARKEIVEKILGDRALFVSNEPVGDLASRILAALDRVKP